MSTDKILTIVSIALTWGAIITGALGIVAGFFWICERVVVYVLKHLKIYRILIEFTFNRAKYRRLLKEKYEELSE